MEELFTEQNQNNQEMGIITMSEIYNAIPYLGESHQKVLLSTYKLTDLCELMNDHVGLEEYLNSIMDEIRFCNDMAYALVSLYNEVTGESHDSENDQVGDIARMYDNLSEEDKKIACGHLMDYPKFFGDACVEITSRFANAVEEQKRTSEK